MLAILLSLLAGLSIGTGDFLAGTQARRTSLWAVIIVSQITGFVWTLAVVAIRGTSFLPPAGLLAALLAGLTAVVGIAASYGALSISVMSIVGPIQATGVAIPVLWGLALGERPGVLQAVGMGIAFAGVVLAAREKSAGERHVAPGRKAVLISLLAAVAIGFNYVCYAYAARYDPWWGVFVARATSISIFLVAFAAVRPRLRLTAAAVLPIMAIGVLDTGSNGLFSVASTLGYLSVVSVLSAVYPVFTVILAHLFFHERLSRPQQIGVAAALAGVGMIAAG